MRWLYLILVFYAASAHSQDVQLTVQTGHAGMINEVIFTPDDKRVITAGADHKIVIWDLLTSKQFGVLLAHSKPVTGISISQDGKNLYSVSHDSTLIVWNLLGESIQKKIKFDYPLGTVLLDHTNNRLIVGGEKLSFVDLKDYAVEELDFEAKELYTAIGISENAELIAFGGANEYFMYLINIKEKKLIRKFVSAAEDIDFEKNEKLFFSTNDGRVVEYTIASRKRKSASTDWMLNSINAVEFNKDKVFLADNAGNVQIVNRKRKWKSLGKYKMQHGKIKDITLSNNGKLLATCGQNSTVVIWELETNKVTKSLKGRVQQINDIAFTKDGSTIVIAFNNGSVRKTNLISNTTIVNIMRPKSQILSNFSRYAIENIEEVGADTIVFNTLYTINSLVHEGAFDKVEEYKLYWYAKENLLELDKVKNQSEKIDQYIKDLKKEIYHNEFYFVDKTQLITENDSIQVRAEVKGDVLFITDLKTNKVIHQLKTGHSDLVTSVAINPVYNYVATASWDGMIRFWDISTGDLLTVYGAFGDGQFVYLDKSGFYFASKNALEYIGFKLNNRLYSFDQFDLKYNRPDIVAKSLPYFDDQYVMAYYAAYLKRLKKLGINEEDIDMMQELPDMIVNRELIRTKKSESLDLEINCQDFNHELDRLHIRVNGVPEFGRFGKKLSGNTYEGKHNIKLNPGTNTIQIYATNEHGVSSYKQTIEIESHQKKAKSQMYLIALGVSKYQQEKYNLKYAEKDAHDIVNLFRLEKILDLQYIQTKLLTDDEVTLENVQALKDFAGQSGENDVLIFFAAGHGVLDAKLDYYYASHDMDFTNPSEKGIPYELFEEIMDASKSRKKVMFLDACHSGEIDKDEVIQNVIETDDHEEIIFRSGDLTVENKYDINSFELSQSLFADMRLNNGSTVISSAGGAEFAIEGDEWNNGVFTYSLLKGLRQKEADLNGDRVIMLSELQKYIYKEVVKMSEGKQNPTSRVENLNNDFRIM
ncbi:caspase family protein [Paracrocinitomix mangrovi]|uniref:caspase family protein n=1 Tax=Paracrocinitomix mangrovi TaxID=2862509 RepID=UPI001C8D4C0F|nr:caspase family protein [Paracrocinitomix mangrovi]UKN00410.1 caspase family protein [Paracrocinitomix mangrovi]